MNTCKSSVRWNQSLASLSIFCSETLLHAQHCSMPVPLSLPPSFPLYLNLSFSLWQIDRVCMNKGVTVDAVCPVLPSFSTRVCSAHQSAADRQAVLPEHSDFTLISTHTRVVNTHHSTMALSRCAFLIILMVFESPLTRPLNYTTFSCTDFLFNCCLWALKWLVGGGDL